LDVADNAGDAVLLHVSASSERQECEHETGRMRKKKPKLQHGETPVTAVSHSFLNRASGQGTLINTSHHTR
jgi:hypothetical protein